MTYYCQNNNLKNILITKNTIHTDKFQYTAAVAAAAAATAIAENVLHTT